MSEFENHSSKVPPGAMGGKRPPGARLAYRRPALSIYGSVRELTGAVSGAGAGDDTTMMT